MIHDHQLMVFPKQLRSSPHSSGVSFMFIHWHFLSRRSTSSISLYVVSIRLLPLSERLLQDERKANTHTTAAERERKTNGISVFLLSNAEDVRVEEMRRCPRERGRYPLFINKSSCWTGHTLGCFLFMNRINSQDVSDVNFEEACSSTCSCRTNFVGGTKQMSKKMMEV